MRKSTQNLLYNVFKVIGSSRIILQRKTEHLGEMETFLRTAKSRTARNNCQNKLIIPKSLVTLRSHKTEIIPPSSSCSLQEKEKMAGSWDTSHLGTTAKRDWSAAQSLLCDPGISKANSNTKSLSTTCPTQAEGPTGRVLKSVSFS